MTLVEFVPPTPHPLWELCPQMGITDVVVKVNPELTGLADPWRYETLSSIVSRLKSAGLNVVGLEGDPFDMSPIKEYGALDCISHVEHVDHVEWNDAQQPETTLHVSARSTRLNNPVNHVNPVKNKDDIREEALSHYRELLESMGRLGIKLLCYNFMVGKGWSRTGVREGRGGAKATYFSLEEFSRKERKDRKVAFAAGSFGVSEYLQDSKTPSSESKHQDPTRSTCSTRLKLSHDQVWANYEYFIKAVMPTAEKCGVRMALHPDDPCLPSLGGYARIFGSIEAYDRAYALYPSPSNAVTFCQANFKLMLGNVGCGMGNLVGASVPLDRGHAGRVPLPDIARHFGKRIAFIHVRDVEGTKEDFTELFHDQGDTDQFALMRTYHELGLDVPVRGDHVPEMAYDRVLTPDGTPGYFTLGRLFANGYLKALLRGSE